jgi:hypothetical protein
MVDFLESESSNLKQLRRQNAKNVIIQRGPQLISLESMANQKALKVFTKKIRLEKRSFKGSYNRLRPSCTPTNLIKQSISYSYSPIKRFNFLLSSFSFKFGWMAKRNPFQNEGLKSLKSL